MERNVENMSIWLECREENNIFSDLETTGFFPLFGYFVGRRIAISLVIELLRNTHAFFTSLFSL